MSQCKAAVDFRFLAIFRCEKRLESVPVIDFTRVLFAERAGALEQVGLDLVEDAGDTGNERLSLFTIFFTRALVAPPNEDGILLDVPRSHFDADGNSFLDPVPALLARVHVTVIQHNFNGSAVILLFAKRRFKRAAVVEDHVALRFVTDDGQNRHVRRRQPGRHHQAVIVAMDHDQPADQACRYAPGCGPDMFKSTLPRLVLDSRCPGEVLPQEMAGTGLQRLAVLHHGFNAQRTHGAREPFGCRLLTNQDRHRHVLLREFPVDVQHTARFFPGLLLGLVCRVSLLPEELRCTQEQTGPQFPADNVCPLVDQHRQVAIALHPLRVHRPDDRFGCRTNHQGFLERAGRHEPSFGSRLKPVMRYDGAFLGKTFDVLGFFLQETERNEEGEIRVNVPRRLEFPVEAIAHVLPESHTPRLDDHAAAHWTDLGEVCSTNNLLIPFRVVLHPRGLNRRLSAIRLCHDVSLLTAPGEPKPYIRLEP